MVPVGLGSPDGCGSTAGAEALLKSLAEWRQLLEGVIGITLLYKCYFAE